MILLSFCAGFSGFWGRLFFSNAPYVQIGEDPQNRYVGDAAIAALQRATDYRKIMLLICGYNNDEAGVVASYKTIARNLVSRGIVDDQWAIIGLLWPDHTTAGFWAAEKSANDSGNRLRDVLKQLKPIEVVAALLAQRNANGVGSPGEWIKDPAGNVFWKSELPADPINPDIMPVPIVPLAANEKIIVTPFGPMVAVDDPAPAPSSGSGTIDLSADPTAQNILEGVTAIRGLLHV